MRKILKVIPFLLAAWLAWHISYLPLHNEMVWSPRRGWTQFPILDAFSLFPWALGANVGSQYTPHGFFGTASNSSNGNPLQGQALPAGSGSSGTGTGQAPVFMLLPTSSDEDVVCHTTTQVWVKADVANTAITGLEGTGTNTGQAGGCPQFPWWGNQHVFGFGQPGGTTFYTPAQGAGITSYASAGDSRIDALIYPGHYGCGGPLTITSATNDGSTTTLNFASQSIWTGTGPGYYVQIDGATSAPALNTPPGTVAGVNLYQVTRETGTSISFASTNTNQTCASGGTCGSAAPPWMAGTTPPFTALSGIAVPGSPVQLLPNFINNSANAVDWSLSSYYECFPITACPYSNLGAPGAGCGINGGGIWE